MLKEVKWSPDRTYRSGGDYEPIQFYLDALVNSNKLDLLLGYFSSASINVLSVGFAKFLSSGGSVRMVINNILSESDKEAIKLGLSNQEHNTIFDLQNIQSLKTTLDEYGRHFFECLAWLISTKKIDLRIIKPKGNGIAHYKEGIFYDGNETVAFTASCNFTAFGLLENLERVTAFPNWEGKLVEGQIKYFEEIFNGQADFVDYLNIDEVEVAIKSEFGNKDLNELLIQEKELLSKKKYITENEKLKKAFEKVQKQIDRLAREPRFPYLEGPRKYQKNAYDSWLANGCKGMFAMATGTGKTITSLNCLLNEYKKSGAYRAIILVPTVALLSQWKKECQKFNFRNIITVCSKEKWNENLSFFNTANALIDASFIVIVTYSTLTRSKFKPHFDSLPKNTLLIADEAHNMGSPSLLKFLPKIHLEKRIGLSATPNRQYDEFGNNTLQAFFNDKPPFTFSYTMKEAMENKPPALCKYLYYPHVVFLDDEELLEYIKISKKLLNYIDPKTGKYKDCPEVENLLLARKRIIHKAKNKKPVFKSIMQSEFKRKGNLKYTLVYVPEGLEADYSTTDEYVENDEESRLINDYTRVVSETDDSIMVRQYTGGTTNRDQVINDFEKGNVHVLTSMKCLDEGVDVPRSELAIFCASTGNPRQFIQRRGRVLRLHDEKIYAVIHDLIVVPKIKEDESNYEMERNLIKKELARVVDFSELSMNKMDTYQELQEILDYYKLNLNDFNTNS